MTRLIEETGLRYGKWLVGAYAGKRQWQCVCDCGTNKVVSGASLRRGDTVSCGCHRVDMLTRHGHAKKRNRSGTYKSWYAMLQRCTNSKFKQYADYGGRGISVCSEWSDFSQFLADMGERPDGFTLDRIDNERGYSKDNCRWATRSMQQRNRRISAKLTLS